MRELIDKEERLLKAADKQAFDEHKKMLQECKRRSIMYKNHMEVI